MSASYHTRKAGGSRWVVVVALALGTLAATTGCDYASLGSWGGLVAPGLTSSLGLPEYPPSYWTGLGMGTQNVWTWGGLADPWYTSSLGLPVNPTVYWR